MSDNNGATGRGGDVLNVADAGDDKYSLARKLRGLPKGAA